MQLNNPPPHHPTSTGGHPFVTTLINAILVVICIMLALLTLAIPTYHQQQETAKHYLQNQVLLLSNVSTNTLDNLITTAKDSHQIILFTAKDTVDASELGIPPNGSPVLLSLEAANTLSGQRHRFNDTTFIAQLPNSSPTVLVATEVPNRKLTQYFIYTGLYLSLAIFAIMFAYSYFSHAKTKRRLRYIAETANDIVNGNLTKRIPINPAIQDEYSEVSKTLNTMLDKNAQLMQDLRQVNNNIAHDLKSPLNRMRSRMEIALLNSRNKDEYQQALSDSINDIDALLKTFQSLLLMGNLDSASRNYQLQVISVSDLLTSLSELYETVAEEGQHTFESHIDDNIHTFANPSLLAQAISNLLENAIKYTPAGGHIQLTLKQQSTGALITVSDNGPGIPKAHHEEVFKRFTRLDSARQLPGTGLGMSLVRSILKVHKANIQLHDNHPGLRVEIRLKTPP